MCACDSGEKGRNGIVGFLFHSEQVGQACVPGHANTIASTMKLAKGNVEFRDYK